MQFDSALVGAPAVSHRGKKQSPASALQMLTPIPRCFPDAQGQTGKYFYVVQSGTCALKVPAKPAEKPGEDAHPEQTVRDWGKP